MSEEHKTIHAEDLETQRPRMEMKEDILEVLCQWDRKNMILAHTPLCQYFGISKWTLNMYLKMLHKDNYIEESDDSGVIRLTEYGRTVGRECEHRHESLSQFLQLVGVERNEAETAACRMEHVVGEDTVDCICRFVNYGNTYERILKNNTLLGQYEPGTYRFLTGIYDMDRSYPRKLALEQKCYQMEIMLEVREDSSWFELLRVQDCYKNHQVWYHDERQGWMKASQGERGECIPASAFEYVIKPGEQMTEGTAVIAFTVEGQEPSPENCRELEVDIW